MTRITIYNVQRAVTPKAGNLELQFLCSAHHIIMIYICIKFRENISNGFQVTERIHILQKKGHNSKSRLTSVMVLMFCTSSHGALYL